MNQSLLAILRDALEDAEYQLSMFSDLDPEDTDAQDAHAKVQGALAMLLKEIKGE